MRRNRIIDIDINISCSENLVFEAWLEPTNRPRFQFAFGKSTILFLSWMERGEEKPQSIIRVCLPQQKNYNKTSHFVSSRRFGRCHFIFLQPFSTNKVVCSRGTSWVGRTWCNSSIFEISISIIRFLLMSTFITGPNRLLNDRSPRLVEFSPFW